MGLKAYGVLRGTVDTFKREEDFNTPHLQIRVTDGQNQAWRVAVNVLSGDQSLVIFHRIDPLLSHPILAELPQIALTFTPLPPQSRSASKALDYLRAPLFSWPTGLEIPSTGPGANDDLQDVLITYLKQLQEQKGELYVFGEKFPLPGARPSPRPIDQEFNTTQGVHDIHMNQGNANPSSFAKDNGVFQDGGLILKFPSRYVGIFLRFQSQWLPTDNVTGHRLPNARPIPAGGNLATGGSGGSSGGNPIASPNVCIERALVNPVGQDAGQEIVVIGNTTTTPIDLTGWSLVDENNKAELLPAGSLAGGESRKIYLSGQTTQLGNKGGIITLKNAAGEQVHVVSYSKADAAIEGRYIRFHT